jgi:cell division inhibitor SulA/protein ImuA
VASVASFLPLSDVLARNDIWRGDRLAAAALPGVATGFPQLDAELPGGGWPRGGLVELLHERSGIGEISLLMPALARISADELAWVVCVAPPQQPYAPAWAAAGVDLSRLLITRASGGDAAWACARVLDTEGVGALLAWLPSADAGTLRRLQLLAERSRILVFLLRPATAAAAASPAPLRIGLEACSGGRLSLRLLKRRGGARAQPIDLDPARPALLRHVVASPDFPSTAARNLSEPANA